MKQIDKLVRFTHTLSKKDRFEIQSHNVYMTIFFMYQAGSHYHGSACVM